MIRRLRERHRRIIPVLALLTAFALAVALWARHRTVGSIPRALQSHLEPR